MISRVKSKIVCAEARKFFYSQTAKDIAPSLYAKIVPAPNYAPIVRCLLYCIKFEMRENLSATIALKYKKCRPPANPADHGDLKTTDWGQKKSRKNFQNFFRKQSSSASGPTSKCPEVGPLIILKKLSSELKQFFHIQRHLLTSLPLFPSTIFLPSPISASMKLYSAL